jgi:uncharacterized paraquat-inducible protein A
MPPSIRVRCPDCDARIKAPIQLLGQRRKCPRCLRSLLIRTKAPEDSSPVLLHDDGRAPIRS